MFKLFYVTKFIELGDTYKVNLDISVKVYY